MHSYRKLMYGAFSRIYTGPLYDLYIHNESYIAHTCLVSCFNRLMVTYILYARQWRKQAMMPSSVGLYAVAAKGTV